MKLSIIVPVYNVAAYLRECLDSVRAQTFADWECVCVDDGSTDGSGAILDEYAAKDGRFRVIRQANAGVGAARNAALEAASGEWLGFIDGDDTVEKDWFARMVSHAGNGVDIVHSNSGRAFGGRSFRDDGTYRTFLRDGWSQLNLVRRSIVGNLRYRTGMRLKEDVVFFTELALKTRRIVFVQEPGYNYRARPDSAIASYPADRDSIRFAEEILRLGLPREDIGRAIGYDLVFWMKGVARRANYDPERCELLKFWRRGFAEGTLRYSDVRWWWRPALRRWIAAGDPSWFLATLKLRTGISSLLGLGL